ncbi:hypothetical protein [Streptomyces sp. NPDC048338]|uniref:hypothetical protein n=1 Tax=Streptomyces sp. NPDC048338 TaxID=3365536 RepID=UPI003715B295
MFGNVMQTVELASEHGDSVRRDACEARCEGRELGLVRERLVLHLATTNVKFQVIGIAP